MPVRSLRQPRTTVTRPVLIGIAAAGLAASAAFLLKPAALRSSTAVAGDYANFEALQVHPLAITPDRTRLLAVNTPDARLEVFAIGAHSLARVGEIPVGLEPVSVSAMNDSIAWTVDNVSDAVSIVDLRTFSVRATLRVGDEPTDVVFAGSPRRAFVCVSGEDAVKLYDLVDPYAPALARNQAIPGTHPRALAARGNEVYVGLLDAGNRTTTVGAAQVRAGGGPPPPSPPRKLQSAPPDVGLIVQKVGNDWVDERPAAQKTWNSVIPYDLPDRDVQVLDASSGAPIRTVSDVGTNLFNLAVAAGSGNVYVTNTEAFNRTRFEPNVRGRFVQNRISRIGPGGTAPSDVWHLNSFIVYDTIPGPPDEKDLSLSQPIDLVVNAAETRVYVAALGSDKVGVLDPSLGSVVNRIPSSFAPLPKRGGPTGLALDEGRGQLFVLNRFANSVSIVDLATESVVGETFLHFDPTPPEVFEGRRFLYDAQQSDHGDLACASCHIAANFDNIAWDLGDPQGDPIPVPPGQPLLLPPFDPMKGPMATQSLRGLSGTGNLHWRADRENFLAFNPAFVKLMGNTSQLSGADMQKYSDFIMTVVYPPNPNQNLDRTWPNPPAPTPSPTRGKVEFDTNPHDAGPCVNCHTFPTGTNGVIIPGQLLQESQGMKVPQLRNAYTKTGFTNAPGSQKRGFGFTHDGSIDNLVTFLHLPVFNFQNEQQRIDLASFVLSFDTGMAPSVGRELTINAQTKNLASATAQLDSLYHEADVGNCDLVAHGYIDGGNRGYRYAGARTFESDYNPEGTIDADILRGLPDAPSETITYLGVPPGAGARMGIDRDRDGYRDRWEMALGSDPANPNSIPSVTAAAGLAAPAVRLMQNTPNPFNPSTAIAYEVPRAGKVELRVFDVAGRLVRTLVDAPVTAGPHRVRWDGRDDAGRQAASGRYYYRLRVGANVLTKEMTLVK